jgi:hypothetical protein
MILTGFNVCIILIGYDRAKYFFKIFGYYCFINKLCGFY